jgi:hypothetical protein
MEDENDVAANLNNWVFDEYEARIRAARPGDPAGWLHSYEECRFLALQWAKLHRAKAEMIEEWYRQERPQ